MLEFAKLLQTFSEMLLTLLTFFWAQAVEEALRKDRDCPAEKETPEKEKGGSKRPRRFAAPSAWPGNVFEFAAQKFTRLGHK